jgi:hypothetical protein
MVAAAGPWHLVSMIASSCNSSSNLEMQLSKQSMQYDVYGVPSPHVLLMETKRQQDYKRFVVPNRNSAGTEVKIQMQAKVVHTSKVFLFLLFFLGRLKVIIDQHEDGV